MQLSAKDLDYLSQYATKAATEAGQLIASYANKKVEVQHKAGGDNLASQVLTEVDLKSEAVIVDALQPSCEQYDLALLTEERTDDKARLEKDYFWCVDPMDGTLSFVEPKPGYAVSIALVAKSGEPVIGVIYDPVQQTLYSAIKGQGAFRNGEPWLLPAPDSLKGKPLTLARDWAITNQPRYSQWVQLLESLAELRGLSGVQVLEKAGAVMNACWALENAPACYFKFPKPQQGGGSLWDFAAIACLFHELGAVATDVFGEPLELNRAESTFMNHCGVIFATDEALAREVRGLLRL